MPVQVDLSHRALETNRTLQLSLARDHRAAPFFLLGLGGQLLGLTPGANALEVLDREAHLDLPAGVADLEDPERRFGVVRNTGLGFADEVPHTAIAHPQDAGELGLARSAPFGCGCAFRTPFPNGAFEDDATECDACRRHRAQQSFEESRRDSCESVVL